MKRRRKPLGQRDREEIDRRLRELHDLQPVIKDAEECGIECQEYREAAAYLEDQLTKIKERFCSQWTTTESD